MSRFRMTSIVACALAGAAHAEITCQTIPTPTLHTNWVQWIAIPRFDPALGFLQEVRLRLDGTVTVIAAVESLDAVPATLTVTRGGDVRLLAPDGLTLLLHVQPTDTLTTTVAGFDGVMDFGGSSGFTLPPITVTVAASTVFTYPSSSANLFVGPPGSAGQVVTPISALGSSVAAGAGNLVSSFNTTASASLEVCYFYDPDCNANGIGDSQDIASGASLDANANGVPDECDYSITDGLCPGDGSGITCPCGNNSAPGGRAGCSNSLGTGGFLVGTGVARIATDSVMLTATGLPASSSTLFFQGTSSLGSDLGVVFGDGLRCAGGAIRRLGTRTAQSGVSSFPSAGSPGIASLGAVTPGARVYQVWYRNAAAFCTTSTFNLTNGVRIVWGV